MSVKFSITENCTNYLSSTDLFLKTDFDICYTVFCGSDALMYHLQMQFGPYLEFLYVCMNVLWQTATWGLFLT